MTIAYDRGYAAGRRGRGANVCPYEGHTPGSFELAFQWFIGNFDGLTARKDAPMRAPRPPRPIKATIRSRYARAQLEAIRNERMSRRPLNQSRLRGEACDLKSRGRRDG